VAAKLINLDGIPAAKVAAISNGVDVSRFAPVADAWERRRLRKERGLNPDSLVIGSVGRLAAVKNHAMMLAALAPIVRQRSDVDVAIVGDGPEAERLQELGRTALPGRLVLAGSRLDTPDWIRCFDVFCMPSDSEGTSIALLEAMAGGVPCVATDVGANGRLVKPPECGLIVGPRDESALRAALLRLCEEADLRASMGAAARSRVMAEFSRDRMVSRYVALYRECA